ncbi:hypothetical protein ACJX0J_010697, partial [Zea mays]
LHDFPIADLITIYISFVTAQLSVLFSCWWILTLYNLEFMSFHQISEDIYTHENTT